MSSDRPGHTIEGTDIAIRVRDVAKRYQMYSRPADRLKQMIWPSHRFFDEISVLQGVNFDVRQGETVGIIGRNGAGKSTLLQMIVGTLAPTEGTIQVQGRVAPLIELGAGFNPEFSGHDNIMIYGQLLGMTRAEMERKYDDIVRFADIGDYFNRPVKTYSSGMYARLAFAVAIHVDPKVLIVDEILAVGDAAFQQKCLNRFYEIKESGCTILIVAHDQYLVRSICDKAVYLKDGKMVDFGPAAEITTLYLEDTQPLPEPSNKTLEDGQANSASAKTESQIGGPAQLFDIKDVQFSGADGQPIDKMKSGDDVYLTMRFRTLAKNYREPISFVFNLYRSDGIYVCGTTTLMEGLGMFDPGSEGTVTVTFPKLPLLAGKYIWRVAINDHGGMLVLAEAKSVCPFRVTDEFKSVGLVHLERTWKIEIDGAPAIAASRLDNSVS